MAESWPIRVPANAQYLELDNIPISALRVPIVINVEVDVMEAGGHIHALQPAEIAMIENMFACEGITLNIEISDTIPETSVIDVSHSFTTSGPTGFRTIKEAWVDHSTGSGWHYCIMAHQYDRGAGPTTSSGIAEILGDDFLVSLGTWSDSVGTPFDRAGTFVHELGHNLGLRHAGDQDEDIVSRYKTNYASVMTYRCQVRGVRKMNLCSGLVDSCHAAPFRDLDYSHGLLPALDETSLDENDGVGLGPVDWDCDLTIDAAPVAKDLGDLNWCISTGSLDTSLDYDDWGNLADASYLAPTESLMERPVTTCLGLEDLATLDESLPAQVNSCDYSSPVVQVEPCIYHDNDADADGILDSCDNCVTAPNPFQQDSDADGFGNNCDNCPFLANPAQGDADLDGRGDSCDNCPTLANANQADDDLDGAGNGCDNCPNISNEFQVDSDQDGVGNLCDNCSSLANGSQADGDLDGIGDACDNCPTMANSQQEDLDSDGVGNLCDNCLAVANSGQADSDSDGLGDACDNCASAPNASQTNHDGDPYGDPCDNCPGVSTPGNIALTTGDCNNNSTVTSADIINLVNFTFKGGPPPIPVFQVGDVNCSTAITSADIIALVNYVFKSVPLPCDVCDLP